MSVESLMDINGKPTSLSLQVVHISCSENGGHDVGIILSKSEEIKTDIASAILCYRFVDEIGNLTKPKRSIVCLIKNYSPNGDAQDAYYYDRHQVSTFIHVPEGAALVPEAMFIKFRAPKAKGVPRLVNLNDVRFVRQFSHN